MKSIINYHVIDRKNIGDLLSSPLHYFYFPGYQLEEADIRQPNAIASQNKHIILGGGGLIYKRFLNNIQEIISFANRGKLILWGSGQQSYDTSNTDKIQNFNYSQYLDQFDLIGIRDYESGYFWLPCVSCMHPAFNQKREIKHEFVVFSHKKFQIKIDSFPRMTNESQNIEEILDFLGSGETILTSSYHGAYWGTLLGRKVLAFPFSSKFNTLKHKPSLYPSFKWRQNKKRFFILNKMVYEYRYKNKFSTNIDEWQTFLNHSRHYPESLEESRLQNQLFYSQVLDIL